MNISLNWLSALLGRSLDPADVGHRLTMLGAAVDTIEPLHQDLGDVVVGLVERVEQHPNADRLSVCRVNEGSAVVQVVCGAPNVTSGKKYPYARVGSVLPGGVKLEARKIRGVSSNGMLCSAKELGLGFDHTGILELDTAAPPGTRLVDAVPVADHRLALDVTANRPDLLCHKGVARELSAVYGARVRLPAFPGTPADALDIPQVKERGTADGVEVAIEDAEGCPRYLAAVIRGVKIGPSPEWLQARLRSVGARAINNVVDATNYVLFELNQPLHAFDLRRLEGQQIVVRRARPGESITTLDGTSRALAAAMTAICDARRPVAVAGVMGGADSEVSGATTEVLLECAYFNPRRIRATRTALKLTTEASYRFERGIDLQALPQALRRAVQLITLVGGGRATGAVDIYPTPATEVMVFLRPERVARLLGTPVPREEIERYLTSVGFAVAPKEGRLAVQVPGWRPDVTRDVDLIEEVARLKGYDVFPVELRPFRPSAVPDDPAETLKGRIRRVFTSRGLHEARSYPLGKARGPEAVEVTNPLSSDDAFLRTDLLPGLIRAAEHNWSVRERDIRLFEIGTVFRRAAADRPRSSLGVGGRGRGDNAGRPLEILRLAAVLSGARTPAHWLSSGEAPDYDLWDLKGLFQEGAAVAGAEGATVRAEAGGWVLEDAAGRRYGWARRLEADRPAWAAPLFGLEIEVDPGAGAAVGYRPLPVTPPVERDLALVLPAGMVAAQVEAVMARVAGLLLERAGVFDEYRASHLRGRSVAWHLVFRAPDRTLRDDEVDGIVKGIVGALREELNVELRAS